MIRIDKISFDFNVENEAFAYDLYAKWDEFCRECFENVVDEYLTGYDRKKMLIEIEMLDIDLGDIPEDDFYRQFPIRLREALQHRLHISGFRKDQEQHLWEVRLENLIYYLENGFCRIEWADPDFNVAEEVDLLINYLPQSMPGLIQSCFNKGYMLERLMMQTDDKAFVKLIEYWNEDKNSSPTDKLLAMTRMATARPELIARLLVRLYSQRAVFEATLSLLESALRFDPSITSATRMQLQLRIMGHLPERLRHHLLDEWKESMLWLSSPTISLHEKRRYLGMILNTHPDIPVHFIHETEEESNLDRMAEILDAVVVKQIMITECEPHAEVDVPVYWHNLYNWLIEYYPFNGLAIFGDKQHFRMHLNQRLLTFIRKRNYAAYLSKEELTLKFLLEVFGHEYYQNVVNAIFNLQPRNPDGSPIYTDTFNQEFYRMLLKLSLLRQPSLPEYHRHEFTYRLMDMRISKEEKLSFLRKMVAQQPAVMQEWICSIGKNNGVVTLLAELTDIRFVHALIETVSPQTAETFLQLEEYIHKNMSEITWLSGINDDKLSYFIRKSMFYWIGLYKGRFVEQQEYTVQFLQMLYLEVTGNGNGRAADTISTSGKKKIEETVRNLSVQLHFVDSRVPTNQEIEPLKKHTDDSTATLSRWINYISTLLKNSSVSNYEKRRILARFVETFWTDCDRMVMSMQTSGLLDDCITMMTYTLFEPLLIQLAKRINGHHSSYLILATQQILAHDSLFTAFYSEGKDNLKKRMLILLAHWSLSKKITGKNADETVCMFLSALYGEEHVAEVFRLIGIRHREIWAWDEEYLSDWLNNSKVSTHDKQNLLHLYIGEQPQQLLNFIRSFVVRQIIPVNRWKEWLDDKDWMQLLAGLSVLQAEIVQQVIHYLLNEHIIKPDTVQDILAKYLTGNEKEKLLQNNVKEIIKQFINTTGLTSGITNMTQNEFLQNIINNLNMNEMEENNFNESQNKPEYIQVSNAGIALFSPFLPRLFSILELLDNNRNFKDWDSRIRAIFILQYLVSNDKTEYSEHDLAFNRILVGCPFSEPLPKKLKLTDNEIQVTDSLLKSLKTNWDKMRNTSIEGIQKAFIQRRGELEQKEDCWILDVEERAYDILIDSIPWSIHLIRYPWMEKSVNIKWRNK